MYFKLEQRRQRRQSGITDIAKTEIKGEMEGSICSVYSLYLCTVNKLVGRYRTSVLHVTKQWYNIGHVLELDRGSGCRTFGIRHISLMTLLQNDYFSAV